MASVNVIRAVFPIAPSARQARRWGALFAGFAAVAAIVIALPAPSLGVRVVALVVGFHVATVVMAQRTGDAMLMRAWQILAPMSVLMVLPDWFLAEVLGTIAFPDTGAPYVGAVPLFMAGMWTVALLPVVLAGQFAEPRLGLLPATLVAAGVGFVIFAGAEIIAPAIPLWEARDVAMVAGLAAYVLIPELVLSAAAFLLVRSSTVMPGWAVVGCAVLLPFTYTGLLAVSYQFLG